MTLQDDTTVAEAPDLDVDAIHLPDVTRRTEIRRQRAERRRSRRIRNLRYAGAALVALLIVVLGVALWPSSKPGRVSTAKGASTQGAAAAVPPVLLAQQDSTGKAVSLTLLVPGAKGKGGALILIPPGTMTEVASLGLEPVGTSLALGGAQRLDATMENLLGVTIGDVLALDDAALTGLVQAAGPLTVRVPERVEQVDATGRVNVLYEPGPHRVPAQDAPAFLAAKGQSNDLARLARHQAYWDAWLARLRDQRSAVPQQPPGLAKAVNALLSGGPDDVVTRVLPVQALGASGEDGELYQVQADELRRMVGSLFPGPRPGASVRPRLQILNGTGAVGLAQQVSDQLRPLGVEVKLTGNAGRLDYTETQVVFYRRSDEAVAQRVQKALGAGRLVLSRNPLDVVDVTVIVGRDYKPQ
ncbi:MAG: hypothetical protein QOK43_2621 [Acidimicrobiaceae bacterium]|nr:hypothetical protein [Acidimicrobiaceae bacterium]